MPSTASISEFFDSGIVHGLNHVHPRNLWLSRLIWVSLNFKTFSELRINDLWISVSCLVCLDYRWFHCFWSVFEHLLQRLDKRTNHNNHGFHRSSNQRHSVSYSYRLSQWSKATRSMGIPQNNIKLCQVFSRLLL